MVLCSFFLAINYTEHFSKYKPESRCWREVALCLRKSSLKLYKSLLTNIFFISWARTLLTMYGRLLWSDTTKTKTFGFVFHLSFQGGKIDWNIFIISVKLNVYIQSKIILSLLWNKQYSLKCTNFILLVNHRCTTICYQANFDLIASLQSPSCLANGGWLTLLLMAACG